MGNEWYIRSCVCLDGSAHGETLPAARDGSQCDSKQEEELGLRTVVQILVGVLIAITH